MSTFSLNLISGRFTSEEAEYIICKMVEAKIGLHMMRIETKNVSNEDVYHSEKRITQLQHEMELLVKLLKTMREDSKGGLVDLECSLNIQAPVHS